MRQDGPLEGWVQGDCVKTAGLDGFGDETWALISQTCDIVSNREWVQLAQVVELEEARAKQAKRGRQPRYVPTVHVSERSFVNLDVVRTVRKVDLVGRGTVEVGRSDEERRYFGRAVGRYYSRAALPDAVNAQLAPILKYIADKEKKNSAEGRLLEAVVSEFRIASGQDWKEATFYLVLRDQDLPGAEELGGRTAEGQKTASDWANAIEATADPVQRATQWQAYAEVLSLSLSGDGPIESLEALAVPQHDLSYLEIRESDRLDLDYLSYYDTPS